MSKKIIRITEVMKLTSLSRATIYRRMSQEDFPKSIKLGGRAIGWLEEEIFQWIEKCMTER